MNPSGPFPISEPQNPDIGELYVVRERHLNLKSCGTVGRVIHASVTYLLSRGTPDFEGGGHGAGEDRHVDEATGAGAGHGVDFLLVGGGVRAGQRLLIGSAWKARRKKNVRLVFSEPSL